MTAPARLRDQQQALADLADAHYAERRSLVQAVALAVAAWWAYLSRGDITGSWEDQVRAGLVAVVVAARRQAAGLAPGYLDAAVAELGGGDLPTSDVVPDAWGDDLAADGRDLAEVLDYARVRVLELVGQGATTDDALDAGLLVAQRVAATEVQDAGREADQVALVTRPTMTGYVRYLRLPSCARCVLLAGRYYRWSAGFDRHPRCDCLHVPVAVASAKGSDAGTPVADPAAAVRAGQVTGLSRADLRALEQGADLGRLVNAKATGLSVADDGNRRRGRRLTPESIYRQAGDDRDRAVALLRRNGYLL